MKNLPFAFAIMLLTTLLLSKTTKDDKNDIDFNIYED